VVEGGYGENTDAIAQALVRWRTIESVHLYGQLSHARYANYVDAAIRTDVSLADDAPTPMCSEEQLADELDAVAIGIDYPPDEPKAASVPTSPSTPRITATPPMANKRRRQPTPTYSALQTTYNLGHLGDVQARTSDPHSYVGRTLSVPNTTWGIGDGLSTTCNVVGYASGIRYQRTSGVYVLHASDDNMYYPFSLRTLRGLLTS
jgi:hypothetical protein